MSLATLSEVIEFAQKRSCGIGMFNIVNLEYAEAVVQAAEEVGLPVMLGFPEAFFQYHSMEMMTELIVGFARRSGVPTVVHLDHGGSFNMILKAMKLGFTSVMFDGSAMDYEENVRKTREIVRIAHAMGVSVEGELGYLGFDNGDESAGAGDTSLDVIDSSRLTRPEQAGDFAERTGIDALAVAIGNMHGHYKGIPKLDLQRLREIKKAVKCGLVLHGGSGLSDEDFAGAVRTGISKINIYTAMNDFVLDFLKDKLPSSKSWLELTNELRISLKDQVKGFIRLFGCVGPFDC
jgi:fructose-bisphosphate aldolase class II